MTLWAPQRAMSALPPKADMCDTTRHVRFGPKADIGKRILQTRRALLLPRPRQRRPRAFDAETCRSCTSDDDAKRVGRGGANATSFGSIRRAWRMGAYRQCNRHRYPEGVLRSFSHETRWNLHGRWSGAKDRQHKAALFCFIPSQSDSFDRWRCLHLRGTEIRLVRRPAPLPGLTRRSSPHVVEVTN
jgi:hypothetical protein